MAQRLGAVMTGEGAIARQHMAALRRIEASRWSGGEATGTAELAAEFGIPRQGSTSGPCSMSPGPTPSGVDASTEGSRSSPVSSSPPREGREPAASVARCLSTMQTLDRREHTL